MKIVLVIVAVVVVGVVLAIVLLGRRYYPPMRSGEILPADEMQKKYGLYIERYTAPQLDPQKVPVHLRDLLPLAKKWGIGDDIIRGDMQKKASEADKQALRRALTGRCKTINEWLDSKQGEMSEEAAAFMYMLEGLDEMHLWPD